MSRIKEIDQKIDELNEERLQLIRGKTVTIGQLMDVVKKYENSTKFNEIYFGSKLILFIDTLSEGD